MCRFLKNAKCEKLSALKLLLCFSISWMDFLKCKLKTFRVCVYDAFSIQLLPSPTFLPHEHNMNLCTHKNIMGGESSWRGERIVPPKKNSFQLFSRPPYARARRSSIDTEKMTIIAFEIFFTISLEQWNYPSYCSSWLGRALLLVIFISHQICLMAIKNKKKRKKERTENCCSACCSVLSIFLVSTKHQGEKFTSEI